MSYAIGYHERALQEYESAMEWYRIRSEQAAVNFEIAVLERIDSLRTKPASFKRTYRYFREVSLKKYPFCVIYLVDEQNKRVIISSIFHHKRNPRTKYKNIK